ncbi:hypothetical protein [Acidithiobacillus sp.]
MPSQEAVAGCARGHAGTAGIGSTRLSRDISPHRPWRVADILM